jgi:hypothetical protein
MRGSAAKYGPRREQCALATQSAPPKIPSVHTDALSDLAILAAWRFAQISAGTARAMTERDVHPLALTRAPSDPCPR